MDATTKKWGIQEKAKVTNQGDVICKISVSYHNKEREEGQRAR